MEISLKTMEVINKLSTSLDIPFDFLRVYISQCIRDCENTKDKYLQVSEWFCRIILIVSIYLFASLKHSISPCFRVIMFWLRTYFVWTVMKVPIVWINESFTLIYPHEHIYVYKQNRRVRLVCALLQSLVRNHIVGSNEDVLMEVQTFCVEFARIKEASVLYRMLKASWYTFIQSSLSAMLYYVTPLYNYFVV